jgi:hypothetical protein
MARARILHRRADQCISRERITEAMQPNPARWSLIMFGLYLIVCKLFAAEAASLKKQDDLAGANALDAAPTH